jgi:hypothetical protein
MNMDRMRDPKSFSQLKRDQLGRENELLSQMMGTEEELKALEGFEGDLGTRQNELLFNGRHQK